MGLGDTIKDLAYKPIEGKGTSYTVAFITVAMFVVGKMIHNYGHLLFSGTPTIEIATVTALLALPLIPYYGMQVKWGRPSTFSLPILGLGIATLAGWHLGTHYYALEIPVIGNSIGVVYALGFLTWRYLTPQ